MQCKWQFRNEVSETRVFRPKSAWKPPLVHASLRVLLSTLEEKLLLDDINESTQSSPFAEEWKTYKRFSS